MRSESSEPAWLLADFAAAVMDASRVSAITVALTHLLRRLGVRHYTVGAVQPDGQFRRIIPRQHGDEALDRIVLARIREGTGSSGWAEANEAVAVALSTADAGIGTMVCGLRLVPGHPLDPTVVTALRDLLPRALARMLRLETDQRRGWLLDVLCRAHGDSVFLFDAAGTLIDQLPTIWDPIPAEVLALVRPGDRARPTGGTREATVSAGRLIYALRHFWLESPVRAGGRVQLVEVRLVESLQAMLRHHLEQSDLTRREIQIAELVLQGRTNREIAGRLFISADTVKTHCRHIFEKFGIARRTQFLHVFMQTAPSGDAGPLGAAPAILPLPRPLRPSRPSRPR
jgi:DNA-binding CsgD family transcriptional regulator